MCELLARAFSFPDETLCEALANGKLATDCASCLDDCGVEASVAAAALEPLRPWQKSGVENTDLLTRANREYTRLYLAPGAHALVFPYESAFMHVERGFDGIPTLFRTALTLDVETQMREAGVIPKNARTEPCDSIFQEFEFLSFLYGNLAAALQEGDAEAVALWTTRADRLLETHALTWMPSFMEQTVRHSGGEVYGALAQIASVFLASLASADAVRESETA